MPLYTIYIEKESDNSKLARDFNEERLLKIEEKLNKKREDFDDTEKHMYMQPIEKEYDQDIVIKCSIEEVGELLKDNGISTELSNNVVGSSYPEENGIKIFWKKQ